MIIEKTMADGWLSNSWLVADEPGGKAVVIDTGGPAEPLLAKVEEHSLAVTHILCTHHHHDHIANNAVWKERFGAPVCGHGSELELFGSLDRQLEDGEAITTGKLSVKALHIPGHTVGQLAFSVNDERVFTGDTLFRRSIGGTRGPGHTTYADIKRSIMDVLMKLPKEWPVHPGHTDPTTIGEEWDENPFVRIWRGADAPGEGRCTAFGKPAILRLRADDYDGGHKCWVTFDDEGDDIVPGSVVKDA